MTIHEFITERLLLEEATLQLHEKLFQADSGIPEGLLAGLMSPTALRADLEATRRLTELHRPRSPMANPVALTDRCSTCMGGEESWPCKTIRIVASRFDSDPGFREEWRG